MVEALQRGKLIEAIKLLRASGIDLKQAKDAIDAYVRRAAQPDATPTSGFTSSPANTTEAAKAGTGTWVAGAPFSADVVEALGQGRKIEAIRMLRRQTGLGLKDAKDAIDAYESMHATVGGLSPGQVPDSGRGIWWAVVLVLVFFLGYLLLRRFG